MLLSWMSFCLTWSSSSASRLQQRRRSCPADKANGLSRRPATHLCMAATSGGLMAEPLAPGGSGGGGGGGGAADSSCLLASSYPDLSCLYL